MAETTPIDVGEIKSVKFKRTVAKKTYVYGTGRGIRASVDLTDNFTPTMNGLLAQLDAVLNKAMNDAGHAIGEAVLESYNKNKNFYSNSDMTRTIKLFFGRKISTLEETGKLRKSLENYDVKVERNGTASFKLHVLWNFPTVEGTGLFPESRKRRAFKYIWVHEFGSANMTKRAYSYASDRGNIIFGIKNKQWLLQRRPFYISGLREGCMRASTIITAALAPYLYLLSKHKVYKRKKLPSPFPDVVPTTTPVGYSLYWVPPTVALAYIGAASDFLGYLQGSFTESALFSYVRQFGWGQFGMTKKSMRRQFRHALWR